MNCLLNILNAVFYYTAMAIQLITHGGGLHHSSKSTGASRNTGAGKM